MKIDDKIIYNNGNYQVIIEPDGTKTRTTLDDNFEPIHPEMMDINISNRCVEGCSFCYINATLDGQHGDFNELTNLLDSTDGIMELALNYSKGSGLKDFLIWEYESEHYPREIFTRFVCDKHIINLTINEQTLKDSEVAKEIDEYLELGAIKGLGISAMTGNKSNIKSNNIVYHVIAGITPVSAIRKIYARNDKMLILGYKPLGRANRTIPNMIEYINFINEISDAGYNSPISFDNLALEQLKIRELVSGEYFNERYMGDEGQFSFYYDLVTDTFARSSTEMELSFRRNGRSVIDMFNVIKDIV